MSKTVEQLKAKMLAAEKALEEAQQAYDVAYSSEELSFAATDNKLSRQS
jgi:hypothetical protein